MCFFLTKKQHGASGIAPEMVAPDTYQGTQMKKKYLFSALFVIALSLFMAGCSGSSSDKGQKKGTPVAKVNWNQEGVTFVDVDGKRIIDTKDFSSSGDFSEGLCSVTDKESRMVGFIDVKGKLVIPCQFPNPSFYDGFRGVSIRCREMFHCGYARVGSSEGNALIDRKGHTVLEGYTALDWDGNVAIVCKDDIRCPGLVTMNGKVIVALGTYQAMEFIGEDMIKVYSTYGDVGIIDTKGGKLVDETQKQTETDTPYKKVGKFVDGYVIVQTSEDEWLAMNKSGKVVNTLPKYIKNNLVFDGQMPDFKDGFLIYDKAILNSSLEKIADYPPAGLNINSYAFVEGMASVYEGSISDPKFGFVNTKGELVVPCKYKEYKEFSDGLAFVKNDEGWHIIDNQGNIFGSLQDKELRKYAIGRFCANRAIINGNVVIDKTGAVIDIPGVDEISGFYYSGNDNSFLSDEF